MAALDLSGGRQAKPLGRAFMSFSLGIIAPLLNLRFWICD
jgi:hypothetical protein